jgi:PAS domain S-box-containing protein
MTLMPGEGATVALVCATLPKAATCVQSAEQISARARTNSRPRPPAGTSSNALVTYNYAMASNHPMASAAHSSEQVPQPQEVRLVIDSMPTLAWSAQADGSADFFNQRWLDYTGLSAEEARDWGWTVALHPDDLSRLVDYWRSVLASSEPGEIEGRLRRFDGVFRWFLLRVTPYFDNERKVVKWFGTNTDIEDRKRMECLLAGENFVLEMTAKGSSLESILEGLCRVVEQSANGCYCSVILIDPDGSKIQQAVGPSLLSSYKDRFPGTSVDREGGPCTEAARHKRQVIVSDVASDMQWDRYGWRTAALAHGLKACWSTIILASNGLVLGTFAIYWREPRSPTDQDQKIIEQITHLAAVAIERKRNEVALRESEERFRLIVDTIPGFVFTLSAAGTIELLNRQALEYFGKTIEEWKNSPNFEAVHPDDLPRVIDAYDRWLETGQTYELELRQRRADGVYRWFQSRALPARDAEGRITSWYILLTDIDDRKRAESELEKAYEEKAKSEAELQTIIDAIPQLITALGPDGKCLYANQAVLEYTGLTKEEMKLGNVRQVFHPEDLERLRDKREAALSRGVPFEYELRVRNSRDGQYRWFLVQYSPLRNERGEIVRWYATGTDIDDRKQGEEKTRQENFVLREQIDQVFMFEEIVGSSPALKTVLSSIVKVAPTDSTVLITGETGTGKELIARAIHKGSQRAGQAFITVNCASIPSSLIASELFGHEKGAFTGALQRRQGRFELAHSGTIFLDEIGELPAETQIALLRVLQERQFERVGGSRVIPTDVRVIAATNRDLSAAITAGAFRADLFYRLNVFPIHAPPLRNRKEDIPMLVEYFVTRYADKAGKHISKIDKNTFKLCQSYHWPGNIRELQNIVERSVILCTGDTFWIDEAWLSSQAAPRPDSSGPLTQNVQSYEKELIEAALGESNGKVAGPNGAAAKLGIPRSTLDLKIKQLNIKKYSFR